MADQLRPLSKYSIERLARSMTLGAAQRPEEPSPTKADLGRALHSGALMVPEAASSLAATVGRQAGAEELAQTAEEAADSLRMQREELADRTTIGGAYKKHKKFLTTNYPAWADWDSVLMNLLEMAPMTVATLGPLGIAARAGMGAAGLAGIGGATEGVLGGGMIASSISQHIDELPRAELEEMEGYDNLKQQGYTEDEIRQTLKTRAEALPVLLGGTFTALTGAALGPLQGRLFGGQRNEVFRTAYKKAIAAGATPATARKMAVKVLEDTQFRSLPSRVGIGYATEAGQEAIQEAGETVAENIGTDRPAFENVGEAMAAGGFMGGLLGGGAVAISGRDKVAPDIKAAVEAQKKIDTTEPAEPGTTGIPVGPPTRPQRRWRPTPEQRDIETGELGPAQEYPSYGGELPQIPTPNPDQGDLFEGTAATPVSPPQESEMVPPVDEAQAQRVDFRRGLTGKTADEALRERGLIKPAAPTGQVPVKGDVSDTGSPLKLLKDSGLAELETVERQNRQPVRQRNEATGKMEIVYDEEGKAVTELKPRMAFINPKTGKTLAKDALKERLSDFDTMRDEVKEDIKRFKSEGYNPEPLQQLVRESAGLRQSSMYKFVTGLQAAYDAVYATGKIAESAAETKERVKQERAEKRAREKAFRDVEEKTKQRKAVEKKAKREQEQIEEEREIARRQQEAKERKEREEAQPKVQKQRSKPDLKEKYKPLRGLKVSYTEETTNFEGDTLMKAVTKDAAELMEEADTRVDALKALLKCVRGGK